MSWLSVAMNDLGKMLEGLAASPTATPAAKTALADLQTAANSVTAAAPDLEDAIVDDVVNYALSKIPFGSLVQGEVDSLVNKFLLQLNASIVQDLGLSVIKSDIIQPKPQASTAAPVADAGQGEDHVSDVIA